MVAPRIDHHVCPLGHVAVDAARAPPRSLMMMMRRGVVLRRQVAGGAERIALGAHLLAVRLVAVAAGDSGVIHAALPERAPDIDLVALLPVDVIQVLRQKRRPIEVEEGQAGSISVGDLTAPRMALRTDIDLGVLGACAAARGLARRRIGAPVHALAFGQVDRETLRWVLGSRSRPFEVRGPRSVAGLAADGNFLVRGVKRVVGGLVILAHVRRVAVGAHEIPVLRVPGPVQFIARIDLVIGIEMKPTLASLRRRPVVPRDRERLDPSIREFDQVLLQRVDAEGEFDFVVLEFPVCAVRVHEVLAVALKEGRFDAGVAERRVCEIAEDRIGIRVLHGARVVRDLPCGVRLVMAAGAGFAADEARGHRRRGGRGSTRGRGGARRRGGTGRRGRAQRPPSAGRGNDDDDGEQVPGARSPRSGFLLRQFLGCRRPAFTTGHQCFRLFKTTPRWQASAIITRSPAAVPRAHRASSEGTDPEDNISR